MHCKSFEWYLYDGEHWLLTKMCVLTQKKKLCVYYINFFLQMPLSHQVIDFALGKIKRNPCRMKLKDKIATLNKKLELEKNRRRERIHN